MVLRLLMTFLLIGIATSQFFYGTYDRCTYYCTILCEPHKTPLTYCCSYDPYLRGEYHIRAPCKKWTPYPPLGSSDDKKSSEEFDTTTVKFTTNKNKPREGFDYDNDVKTDEDIDYDIFTHVTKYTSTTTEDPKAFKKGKHTEQLLFYSLHRFNKIIH